MDIKSCLRNYLGKYKVKIVFLFLKRNHSLKIKNSQETIAYIIKNKCSVSRYGDGEFNMVFHYMDPEKYPIGNSFQKYDEKLAQKLYSLLKEKEQNLNHIVCIPYWFISDFNYYVKETRLFCKKYLLKNHLRIWDAVNLDRTYYDANISRFYLSFKDKSHCREYVSMMQQIWENRDIYFVEGEYSRLGVGNDLFKNSTSIHRILCPAINAFDYYNEILETIIKTVPLDGLIIIALGHTATVLAYELSLHGYQAIDLGHIDVEYEWMLQGVKTKIALSNKYVNEVKGGSFCEKECLDEAYQKQIIAKVFCK